MADVRVVPADDAQRYLDTDELVWFAEPSAEPAARALSGLREDQRFGAEVAGGDPAYYAGVYGVYALTVTVPGPHESLRQVPVSGLTFVGVHPDERRRGVLTAMLQDHFGRVREGDWSGLSALHASEPSIYGRHGYGVASWETRLTLARGATLTAPGLEEEVQQLRTRLATTGHAGVAARMRAAALHAGRTRLGSVVREEMTYEMFGRDTPQTTRDKEPQRALFAVRDGVDVGYAWFRRAEKWEEGRPEGTVKVGELVGDPAAELALVRRLVDLDLTSSVVLHGRGVDDPVVHWAGGPRTIHGPTADSLWLRLVDLPRALEERGYAESVDLVLDVEDAACEWNHGRWRLTVGDDGTARVARTDDEPDLRLTTQVLASVYLGSQSLVVRHTAGLVEELRDGAVRRLDKALRMPQPAAGAVGF
ncbi:GNAT family N-acetyltransferase [Segeticoccus rhizosphaerae]|jgi:predicted acetyltransferase|uniref:GNAT family N-acetyltransferase n=1 Tax=Segeticoccus rhizosphaerae TaxID=1104777 RepID=UPI0010BFADC5|nr:MULTISPECIES: GNAT family N-acetyltransferase [Intrasporangiaceae]